MIIFALAYGFTFSYAGLFGLDPSRTGYTEFRPTDGSERDVEDIKHSQTARQFEEMAQLLFEGADS